MTLILLVLFLVGHSSPLTALVEDCKDYIEKDDKTWNLYQIAKPINLTEIRCYKRVEQKFDCFANYAAQSSTLYENTFENCRTALKTKLYVDANITNYRLHKLGEEIVVGDNDNSICTYIYVGSKSSTGYLFADKVVMESGSVCDYSSGYCYNKTTTSWITWPVISEPSEVPSEKYKYKLVTPSFTNSYFLNLAKKYLILERDSEGLALKITKESRYYNRTRIWHIGQTGMVLANTDIYDSWDKIKYQQSVPNFISKTIFRDLLATKCRLYYLDRHEDRMLKNQTHIQNDLQRKGEHIVSYYLGIFNTLCVLCIVLFLVYGTCKKIFCVVRCGPTEKGDSSRSNMNVDDNIYETVHL